MRKRFEIPGAFFMAVCSVENTPRNSKKFKKDYRVSMAFLNVEFNRFKGLIQKYAKKDPDYLGKIDWNRIVENFRKNNKGDIEPKSMTLAEIEFLFTPEEKLIWQNTSDSRKDFLGKILFNWNKSIQLRPKFHAYRANRFVKEGAREAVLSKRICRGRRWAHRCFCKNTFC